MKVRVRHINSSVAKEYHNLYNEFIIFLNKEYPLKKNITIIFSDYRIDGMSTGALLSESDIMILTNGRINRDIMRSLAHEWIHGYQMNVLKRKKGKDIGGRDENEANAVAGRIVKEFELLYPHFENQIYE